MERKHLFILCPPSSGSTLLQHIMKTSPHVSDFNTEGQAVAESLLFTQDRWNPKKQIPWDKVKEKWLEKWDLNKPILLEKSPPHLIRAQELQNHFPDSYFLIMVRNPYAFCESVKRKWGKAFTYYNIARFWTICIRYQIANIKNLRHTLWFTYENLTETPVEICRKIIDFMPQVEVLDPGKKFHVSGKSMNITNLNQNQISRLTPENIFEINQALKRYPDLMTFFNYPLMDAQEEEEKMTFKTIKIMTILGRSLYRLPGPVRWHSWGKITG